MENKDQRIKMIMDMLNSDTLQGTEEQQSVKKKIVKRLIGTMKMDPFNNKDDAKKILKILNKCKKQGLSVNLDAKILGIINFLETVLLSKLENSLDNEPSVDQSVLDPEDIAKVTSLLGNLSTLMKDVIGDDKKDLDDISIIKRTSTDQNIMEKMEKLFSEQLKKDEDIELDISELASNGSKKEDSGLKLSKLLEIKYQINPDKTVSLLCSNLPKDISNKEFKAILEHSGLAVSKKMVLEQGDISLKARIVYSDKFLTFFPVYRQVKITTTESDKSCFQKFLIIERCKNSSGKTKLKIPAFMNEENMKVKQLVPKTIRDFIKSSSFNPNEDVLVPDKCAIDDEDNIYSVCFPFERK